MEKKNQGVQQKKQRRSTLLQYSRCKENSTNAKNHIIRFIAHCIESKVAINRKENKWNQKTSTKKTESLKLKTAESAVSPKESHFIKFSKFSKI